MAFVIGMALGALVFSLILSPLANIRDSRTEKTVYEIWLDGVANDNIVPARRDFSSFA
jgi:hypothetical protein